MSTVHVVLSKVRGRARSGGAAPVSMSVPITADTVTSGAASSQSTITAADVNAFWTVVAKDAPVWVMFGSNPVAAADSGWLLLAGSSRDFAVSASGEKIAVKDA